MTDSATATATPATAWWRHSDADLAAALAAREELLRRAQAEQGQILAAMRSRGSASTLGYPDVVRLQMDLLRITRHDARQRFQRAVACNPLLDGASTIEPPAPATGQAFAEGAIGIEHVQAVTDTLKRLPATMPVEQRHAHEKTLADLARAATPREVRKAGQRILFLANQDGPPPPGDKDHDQARPRRELRTSWDKHHQLRLSGTLDEETGALLHRLLSPLAKPRPAQNGQPDPRSLAQRHGDALAELLEHAHRTADQLPTEGGVVPTVIVTMTLDQLLRTGARPGDRPPTMNWDTPITAEQARRYACDANLIPAVLGGTSQPLDLGRAVRTATPAQRRALALRDGGCVFPGCPTPPQWTQAHHIGHWDAHHGRTDLANLCLLCGFHHRLIHHSDWDIRMAEDGHPECIPPDWIDPRRQPRRNHTHHQV